MTQFTVDTDSGTYYSTNPTAPSVRFEGKVVNNYFVTVKVTKTLSTIKYPRPLKLGIEACITGILGTVTQVFKAQIEDGKYP